ncbi:FtsK/SpoIIIE domain-containing protein [Micrococcus sp. TA1]|uniref:FtsK/SpoIIIE domain-containing protein n=1 Tax=Micrococcus sp. TA1 TaxID=681627 RepID=UPI00160C312A|nr:FtsK/SpoIIIE domain-containing protein [Micrococcus sp. TA1]MBB5748295.1 S-DNA-T family DNA segregation ATPase FtsK/SpoIIIE [Micrococcus sp. TA1]
MRVRILGLADGVPCWWSARNMEGSDGPRWDALLRRRLPGYRFSVCGRPLEEAGTDVLGPSPTLCVVARPSVRPVTGRESGPEVVLVVEDGPDAGLLAPLPRSGVSVGRNHSELRIADPFLSAPHFRAVVEPDGVRIVRLAGSRANPATDGDGPPRTGSSPWREGSSGFRLVRGRPEPLPARAPLPSLTLDPGQEPTRPNVVMQAVMALGPLVIGLVLAVVTGHWYFLLFSLISVGVAGVMWAQHRSARSAHGRRITAEAARLGERLEALAPAPGAVALAARSAATDRFGTLGPAAAPPLIRWGTGTATLPLATGREGADWSAWSRATLPVITDLHPGGTTRVIGQRSTVEAISHWLVVQLCRDAVATSRGVLVRRAAGDAYFGGGITAAEGTAVLHAGAAEGALPAGWHRVVLGGAEDGGDDRTGGDRILPDQARATVGGLDYEDLRWHGMSASTAGWLVDELGGSPRPRVPPSPPRMELPLRDRPDTAVSSLRSPLTGGTDPVRLDLVREGPHALIAGTTGSGKSELLLTVLTGLAAAYPPGEVSFVLMDFKGGSSFAPLSGLPHTMSVETNLVEAESLRTFDALTAELRHREELFLSAGSVDYAAYRRSHPGEVLPRLVVAIDELRVLVEDHPQSAAVLARLAATGRSLGFHLVLATQRAQGAVGPDVRSNLGTIVCLRTATEQESWDLLGSPQAHSIGPDSPGQAFIRHGGAPPRAFRAGRFTAPPGPPDLVPWDGRDGAPGGDPGGGGPADWPGIVDRIRCGVERGRLAIPEPVVMPALPDRWCPTAAERLAHPGAVVVGLADAPGARRQGPVVWSPGRDGPAAWIGTDTGGIRDAARSTLRQLVGLSVTPTGSPTAPRTVVLDGDGDILPEGVPFSIGTGEHRSPGRWTVLSPALAVAEQLGAVLADVREDLAARRPVRLVVTAWGRWAGLRVGTGYETAEEHLSLLLRDHPPSLLAVALFGGRELAGGRVLGQVPTRFYLPAGSTPEQRMVWPTLHRVREVPGRAVMVTSEHPAPGVAVQLALDVTEPGSAPPAPTRTHRSA